MAASRDSAVTRPALALAIVAALGVGAWFFPLFRVVSLKTTADGDATRVASGGTAFDAATAAAQIWARDLPAAAARAVELKAIAPSLRRDPVAARRTHAQAAGLGTAYYFVRGRGRVVAREGSQVHLALDGAEPALVALRIGPIFGNAVRDGCGLLDVNSYPGLQEFNALAAELNALVEKHVLPLLRERAVVGTIVQFAGCAEAPESVGSADAPLLVLVPVRAEIH